MRNIKKIAFIVAIISIAIASFSFLSGCSPKYFDVYDGEQNFLSNLDDIKVSKDGKSYEQANKLTLKGKVSGKIYIDLGETKELNTITIKETGNSVKGFAISAKVNQEDDFELIYKNDIIGDMRACLIEGGIVARYLCVQVIESFGSFKIKEINAYNILKKPKEFRVNAYMVANSINEDTNWESLETCTDVIFFGMARFNKEGDIQIVDENGIDITASYEEKLQMLKTAIGQKDINIICDIHTPYESSNDPNGNINYMFENNMDKVLQNIKGFVELYGFDGYDIDYEYPYSRRDWKNFNEFLVRIDETLPDKIISIAGAGWSHKFSKQAIKAIDRIEVMVYDLLDKHGNHCTFDITFEQIQRLLDYGFDPNQLDVGLPFYSRPLDCDTYWGSYKDVYESLGKYSNLYYGDIQKPDGTLYPINGFNGYQLIQDKTAFSVDSGLGGVMIWHYHCDVEFSNELSLFKAIDSVLSMRIFR